MTSMIGNMLGYRFKYDKDSDTIARPVDNPAEPAFAADVLARFQFQNIEVERRISEEVRNMAGKMDADYEFGDCTAKLYDRRSITVVHSRSLRGSVEEYNVFRGDEKIGEIMIYPVTGIYYNSDSFVGELRNLTKDCDKKYYSKSWQELYDFLVLLAKKKWESR